MLKTIKTLLVLALAFLLCFQLWQTASDWWREPNLSPSCIAFPLTTNRRASLISEGGRFRELRSYGKIRDQIRSLWSVDA